jgi:endothelin-converting enzyme
MSMKIGYQTVKPNVVDPKSISDWYSSIKISNSHFANQVEFNKFRYNATWADLTKPADPRRWTSLMSSSDGGYDPLRNEVTYPAGDMQLPQFAVGLPDYVLYAGFGSMAGYDIFHAMDRNGSKYDASGKPAPGWDATTSTKFDKKSTCLVDQYNKYTVQGDKATDKTNVNGTLTLLENVADAAGLSTAFAAWEKRNKAAPNPSLPGLENYTNEQLFFLSFATSSCGKRKPADQAKALLVEPHSPLKYRVLGPLSNSEAFRKAFKCPTKQPVCEVF